MSDLLYTVTTRITPQYEEEFNAWQETEHCPLLLTIDGYHSVMRYKDLDSPYVYSNFWYINSMDTFEKPERLRKAFTPWGNWLSPFRDRHMNFYTQKNGGLASNGTPELMPEFSLLLIYELSFESAIDWYQRCYIEEARKIPQVLDIHCLIAYQKRAPQPAVIYHFLSGGLNHLEETVIPTLTALSDPHPPALIRRYWCISKRDAKDYSPHQLPF